MESLDFTPIRLKFSWNITTGLKNLLLKQNNWPAYFLIPPDVLATNLNTLYEQIKSVNFFDNPSETDSFFLFLKKLVETKPTHDRVLREFSQITAEILDKLSQEPRFESKQAAVVIHYLQLLGFMLKPNYRYLFNKAEISLWTNDFQKIANTPFNSSEILSNFRDTLLLSFQSIIFTKNYPALIQTIGELACSLDKARVDSNELEAMKLFDTLGVLDHILKTSQIYRVKVNQAEIALSIQTTRTLLYDQFIPFVEKNFLQFITYKSYLAQSYPNSTQLVSLCDSENYRAQCKSDYTRFKDSHHCTASNQLPNFSIEIKHNNHSKLDLDKMCVTMRSAESFVPWMEKVFGFKPNYNTSQYRLHLSDSKKNFQINKALFEHNFPKEQSHTTLATYFQPEKPTQIDPLMGSTYAYTVNPIDLIHEYIHHLYALFLNDLELDLTSTEGIAELYSGGICSERNIHDLRNSVNDTYIFEFFKAREYPFYFNALKWVAYLVNQQPELFKTLVSFLQNNNPVSFYDRIDTFIGNASNTQEFLVWSNQQVNICNLYLHRFPDGHQPPMIYLDDIKLLLNQTQATVFPLPKRSLLSYTPKDVHEIILVYPNKANSRNEDVKQPLKWGFPLPFYAMLAGFTSSCLDDVGLAYKNDYPSLSRYINYGFKPFFFALVSAALNTLLFDSSVEMEEKFTRLFTYFAMNYLSVFIAQPLTSKLAEKIQNKMLCFFVQMLTWTLLWNPSLFILEDGKLLPTLFLQLMQGLGFKIGQEAYHMGKNVCVPPLGFWHKKQAQRYPIDEASLNNDEEIQVSKIRFG